MQKPRRARATNQIRLVKPDGSERFVEPGQLDAENELKHTRERREMRRQQELFALKRGDVVTVARTSSTLHGRLRWYADTGMWLFTVSVDGVARTVKTQTIVLESKTEETVNFGIVSKYTPANVAEVYEADRYRMKLGMPLSKPGHAVTRAGGSLLPPPDSEPTPACIGYLSG